MANARRPISTRTCLIRTRELVVCKARYQIAFSERFGKQTDFFFDAQT
jgi:hypothetical protein